MGNANTKAYEFLPHTADVKFRVKADTWEELFIGAANALNEVIRGNIKILHKEEKILAVTGTDMEVLLHNFLEEFVFLLEAHDYLSAQITHIKFDKEKLSITATVTGDKAEHYKFTNDVKAITFNEMYIKEQNEQYVCQVVLDV